MSFTPEQEELLKLLLEHLRIDVHWDQARNRPVTELRLKNVAMWSDVPGASAVVIIDSNGVNGVQRPIGTRGSIKCFVCDEYLTGGRTVCENCVNAVKWARTTNAPPPTRETLELLKKVNDAGLLDALILMNKENIKKWMDNETEGMK